MPAMSRISRDSFVDSMDGGEALDVKTLGSQTKEALVDAGLKPADLARIAGSDGVIGGKDELGKLFDFVDRADHNGSYRSIDTMKRDDSGHMVETESGKLYEALQHEREKARLLTPEVGLERLNGRESATPRVRSRPAGTERAPTTKVDLAAAKAKLQSQGFHDIHITGGTPYYNQGDLPWKAHPYPKTPPETDVQGNRVARTIQKAGCAPTALAMADVALRGSTTTPAQLGDFSVAQGLSGQNGGHGSDTHGIGKAWAKAHDLEYTPARSADRSSNVDTIRDGLRIGGVGVISVGVDERLGKGHFTEKGHVMLINGYARDKEGKEWFFLVNPGRDDQNRGRVLTTDESVVQDRTLHHGAGQLRISREQLEAEMKNGFVLSRRAGEEIRSR
jgi:hypothetical protein